MVNFRYHVVSIVAVFLALAIGILMGTTVVSKETLRILRNQIKSASQQIDDQRAEAGDLRDDLQGERERYEAFVEQSGPRLVERRLDEVPVMVVAVRGVDEDPIEELRTVIADAGARFEGTLWLTDRLLLDNSKTVDELARILGLETSDGGLLRTALASRLGAELLAPGATAPGAPSEPADGEDTGLLAQLATSGFIDYEPPDSDALQGETLPLPGTRYAVVSGDGASIPDDGLVYPLLRAMTVGGVAPVVAAEPRAEGEGEEETRAVFVGELRDDDNLVARLSSVDNLEDFTGQAAVVFALEDLGADVVGHFGVGDGAQRLLPAPVP